MRLILRLAMPMVKPDRGPASAGALHIGPFDCFCPALEASDCARTEHENVADARVTESGGAGCLARHTTGSVSQAHRVASYDGTDG